MRPSIHPLLLLVAALTIAPGCDELDEPADAADDDDIQARCSGPSCTIGGLGNTSKIGRHALSNMVKVIGVDAANMTAKVRITGGTFYHFGLTLPIQQIEVDPDGELRLRNGTVWAQGAAVKNAWFNLLITPNDPNRPAFTGKLKIADAICEPGEYDAGMTICRYVFITDVVPDDPGAYPMHDKYFGWYHTCPNEDEEGMLPGSMKFSSVLSPQVRLQQQQGVTPRVDPASGHFINGCLNGAVSKTQFWLNAFYDPTAYRGLLASQRTPALLMWMAWHGGESRTIPGQTISPHDPHQGLFTWTDDPDWGVEGGYGGAGAVCRGGSLVYGLHRHILNPVLNLVGWDALPHCDENDIAAMAPVGVKVPELQIQWNLVW